MRNLLLILLVFFLFSCDKEDQTNSQTKQDTFTAKRNGVTWGGTTEVRFQNGTDTLTILGIANHPNDEVIGMKIKFEGAGQYTLIKKQASYYTTVGGDVIISRYKLLPGSVGQLIISKYDAEKKQIAGNFKLDLKLAYSYSGQDADTLKVTDGNFTGTIRE